MRIPGFRFGRSRDVKELESKLNKVLDHLKKLHVPTCFCERCVELGKLIKEIEGK